jgi:pyridoxamine 5'-phosphate oxidase
MSLKLSDIRKDYVKKSLSKSSVSAHPMVQFEQWLSEAIDAQVEEPTAMLLTTVSPEGRPSARVVLLKEINDGKLVFFTNYQSKKGRHIENKNFVSATFFWPALERQVHVEGAAEKVEPQVSDVYFQSRPRKSRIGAIISPQSEPIENREVLMAKYLKTASQYLGRKITRPEHWGGYAISPDRVEFWQGRPSRLHDRILYTAKADGNWHIARLAP